jgi:phage gpG-like protein
MGAQARQPLDDLAADFGGAGGKLRADLSRLLKLYAVAGKADAKQNFERSESPNGVPWRRLLFPRVRGGDKPLRDTGLLMASISGGAWHVERTGETWVEYGTRRVGARLMNDGGVVHPTRGKYLAIPKTKEALRAGSARNFPRELTPIFGKKGGVLVETITRGRGKGTTVVHYVLTKQVTVPARPFLGAGDRLKKKLADITRDFAVKLLRERGRK